MRFGLPCASITRSSGPVGKPSGGDDSGVSGAVSLAGRTRGAGCFGNGGFARWEPGASIAPSSICRRWIARQLWKPLACAETPRIACIATGRPAKPARRLPVQSVHGSSTKTSDSNATWAISSARRSMVAGSMPQRGPMFAGAYSSSR